MAILHKKGNLSGSAGNVVFRTVGDQTVVQSKPKKFKQTPNSQESALEFGLASATAASVRDIIVPICGVADKKIVNRLNRTVLKAIRGSSKERGERDLHDGDLSRLKGFQLNVNSPLTEVLSIRPESSMPAPGQLKVNIPSFTLKGNQGPGDAKTIRLRLLVTAFHFKEQWAHFVGHEDIDIKHEVPFQGKEWLFEDLPLGTVLIVTVSLHATTHNTLDERLELNTRDWSPAEIIGAYHILDENGQTLVSSLKERNIKAHALGYSGNSIFTAFRLLWDIYGKPEKPQPKPPRQPGQRAQRIQPVVPTGRVKLKR